MAEYSVLFDPRLDPTDENDAKIIFEITKLQNEIHLRERLYKANQDIYGVKMGDNKTTITQCNNYKNNVLLDLDTVQNIPVLKAYGGFPSMKAKKSKATVPYQEIPKESMTVHEQVCYQRRQLDSLMNKRRQLKNQIKLKKNRLPLPTETEKEREQKEQKIRQIVNSICKMNSKLSTSTNLYYSYQKILNKVKRDVLEFPEKLKKLEQTGDKLVADNAKMHAELNELTEDLARLEKAVTTIMHDIKTNRTREKETINKLRVHIDPIEHSTFFSPEEVKFALTKALNEPIKPMSSMSNLPQSISPYEKKEMVRMMKEISVYKHIGSKLSAITGIPFDEAEQIGEWFKACHAKGKAIDKFATRCANSKKKKQNILHDLRATLNKLRAFESTFVETKIKAMQRDYNKIEKLVRESRNEAMSKKQQARVMIISCGKWLEKFMNFIPLEVAPTVTEVWLTGDLESFDLFLDTMHNVSKVANDGIFEVLKNSSDSADLPIALKSLEANENRELMEALVRAQTDPNYGSDPDEDILFTLTDPKICKRFLKEITEEQKFRLMHAMFTSALECGGIRMNSANQRINFKPPVEDDVDELFDPDDPNYTTRSKLKKPRFMAGRK